MKGNAGFGVKQLFSGNGINDVFSVLTSGDAVNGWRWSDWFGGWTLYSV